MYHFSAIQLCFFRQRPDAEKSKCQIVMNSSLSLCNLFWREKRYELCSVLDNYIPGMLCSQQQFLTIGCDFLLKEFRRLPWLVRIVAIILCIGEYEIFGGLLRSPSGQHSTRSSSKTCLDQTYYVLLWRTHLLIGMDGVSVLQQTYKLSIWRKYANMYLPCSVEFWCHPYHYSPWKDCWCTHNQKVYDVYCLPVWKTACKFRPGQKRCLKSSLLEP